MTALTMLDYVLIAATVTAFQAVVVYALLRHVRSKLSDTILGGLGG